MWERLRHDIYLLVDRYGMVDLQEALEPGYKKRVGVSLHDGQQNLNMQVRLNIHSFDVSATVSVVSKAIDENGTNLNSQASMTEHKNADLV